MNHSKYSLHGIMCNIGIFKAFVSSGPSIMRIPGICRTLSNMYDELISTEPSVTPPWSELESYSEQCQRSVMMNFI